MSSSSILASVTLRTVANATKQHLHRRPGNVLASVKNFHASSLQCYKARWVAPTLRELQKRKLKEIALNGGNLISQRNTFLDWNYDAELYAFGKRLNESFDDAILRQVFTYSSYVYQETKKQRDLGIDTPLELQDNRELAKEGYELLKRFLYGYLRANLTHLPEEGIESIHEFLMNPDLHGHIAKHLGMSDLILCMEYPPSNETLNTSFHALIACVHRSSGEDKARRFAYDFVAVQLANKSISDLWQPINPMGILVDALQKMGRGKPEPRLIRKAGSNTILATYHVGIYSDKKLIGSAPGESPEIAEELAARDACNRLFDIPHAMNPLPLGVYLAEDVKHKAAELENRAKAQSIS
nr:EOG090X0DYO [Triops cancriformis]